MSGEAPCLMALARGPLTDRKARTKRLFDALFWEVFDVCAWIELHHGADKLQPPEIDVVLSSDRALSIPLSQTAAFRAYCAGRSNGTCLDDEMARRGAQSSLARADQLNDAVAPTQIVPVRFFEVLDRENKPRRVLSKLFGLHHER